MALYVEITALGLVDVGSDGTAAARIRASDSDRTILERGA
jgi:hypothetical protein